jgi:hypothetical protein
MSYFTTAEFRTLPLMDDSTKYPDDRVAAEQAFVESLIERVCGTSFVGVSTTETLDGNGRDTLTLGAPYVLTIDSVEVGGTLYDAGELAAVSFKRPGLLRQPLGGVWPCGRDNVVVTYTAGYSSTPPGDLKAAAMTATRYRVLGNALASKVSDRATSFTNEQGQTTLAVAGENRPTGLPEVDAVILGWAAKVNLFGFGA